VDRAEVSEPEFADDGALRFTASFTRQPEIGLGGYKGLQGSRRVSKVTDEQVGSELERLRARRARYEELAEADAIEKGDLVVVDYEMYVEGERREDASATGYPLEVGEDQLFPEMNEALVGAKVGETREFEVSYPEGHSDESLRGKTAQFKATAREARRRRLPELNDEFAKEIADVDTLEELRKRVRERLEAISNAMADDDVNTQLLRMVSEGAALDVPEALVDRELTNRMEQIEQQLDRRNLTLPEYLRNVGRSYEDWRADIEAESRQAVRSALVVDEIGERESIQVTEEELHEEMHRRAEMEGVDEEQVRERLGDSGELRRMVNRLYHRKIVQFLRDNAEVTEEEVEPEPPETEGQEASSEVEEQASEEEKGEGQ
jgi:trigger factor